MMFVVFSSFNGGRTLPDMLTQCAALQAPACGVAFVAVDNGSIDSTGKILREERAGLSLTVLDEAGRGKNCALNTAMRHVSPQLRPGDLVVLTDDDVLPQADWLVRIERAAHEQPDFSIFAGAIRPHWPDGAPPKWVIEWGVPLDVTYAVTSAISGPVPADLAWGPNMTLRAEIFLSGHGFNPHIGPDGTPTYAMGSDTEFAVRLERAGFRAWFVDDAVVNHMVRPEQIDEAWVVGRAFRHGAGYLRYHAMREGRRVRVFGLPPRIAVEAAAYRAASTLARIAPRSRRRFQIIYHDAWMRGLVSALRSGAAAHGASQANGGAA